MVRMMAWIRVIRRMASSTSAFSLFLSGFLQTGQGGTGTGDAHIPGFGVLLERQAAGKTAFEAPGVEGVQEFAVIKTIDPQLGGIFIREGPADIIMAAHIIDPGTVRVDA